jgi:hypothetical protein
VYSRRVSGNAEHPQAPTPDEGGITRRQFVGTGVAVGAAIVWTAPFADAAVGKVLSHGPVTGTTGTTGPASPTGTTSTGTSSTGTTSTGTSTATGATGATGTGPSQRFEFPAIRIGQDGALTLTAFLPGPGRLHVTATTETTVTGIKGVLAAALKLHRVDYATYTTVAHHRGLIHARIHPTKSGAALVARDHKRHKALHIRVTATFTPVGGRPKTHEHGFTFHP